MAVTVEPKSDLPVRAASGFAMIAVAGAILWVGGVAFALFVIALSVVAAFELVRIAGALPWSKPQRGGVIAIGIVYIAAAAATLIVFRNIGLAYAIFPVVVTIATDVGAYFAGRAIGGPKIAPRISPSKTWAGLVGGMVAAGFAASAWAFTYAEPGPLTVTSAPWLFGAGAALAIIAQMGDFAESFLKRKAGVKDSGAMIPGHGGVLDRIDGLLAVLVVCGLPTLVALVTIMLGGDVLPSPA